MLGNRPQCGLDDLFEIHALVENLTDFEKQRELFVLSPKALFGGMLGQTDTPPVEI